MEEVVKCPVCDKRIFDLEWQGWTVIKIKCFHCRHVVAITKESRGPKENRKQAI